MAKKKKKMSDLAKFIIENKDKKLRLFQDNDYWRLETEDESWVEDEPPERGLLLSLCEALGIEVEYA